MRVGTYPTRHLATYLPGVLLEPPLRGSELPPAFSGAYGPCTARFTNRHWPGFTSRTQPFGLAGSYVFIKQSGPPSHCDLRSHPFGVGRRHPFYRRYGANLPSSLARSTPIRLRLLTQGHLCRFLARSRGLVPAPLFTGSRDQPKPPYGGPIPPSPGSRRYGPPQAYAVGPGYGPARPTPKRQGAGLRRRNPTPVAPES